MIRRPPRSTLFPTRRSPISVAAMCRHTFPSPPLHGTDGDFEYGRQFFRGEELKISIRTVQRWGRSEEHTSELQSQSNLVCRLLLEKKKKHKQQQQKYSHILR